MTLHGDITERIILGCSFKSYLKSLFLPKTISEKIPACGAIVVTEIITSPFHSGNGAWKDHVVEGRNN